MKLSDVPFPEGKTDFKVTEEQKQLLVNEYTKMPKSHVANFVTVTSGGNFNVYISQSCHASVAHLSNDTEAIMTEVGCSRRYPDGPFDVYKDFANWFIKESFLSRFISNNDEDIDTILKSGVIVSVDVPQPVFQAICIMSRHYLK